MNASCLSHAARLAAMCLALAVLLPLLPLAARASGPEGPQAGQADDAAASARLTEKEILHLIAEAQARQAPGLLRIFTPGETILPLAGLYWSMTREELARATGLDPDEDHGAEMTLRLNGNDYVGRLVYTLSRTHFFVSAEFRAVLPPLEAARFEADALAEARKFHPDMRDAPVAKEDWRADYKEFYRSRAFVLSSGSGLTITAFKWRESAEADVSLSYGFMPEKQSEDSKDWHYDQSVGLFADLPADCLRPDTEAVLKAARTEVLSDKNSPWLETPQLMAACSRRTDVLSYVLVLPKRGAEETQERKKLGELVRFLADSAKTAPGQTADLDIVVCLLRAMHGADGPQLFFNASLVYAAGTDTVMLHPMRLCPCVHPEPLE